MKLDGVYGLIVFYFCKSWSLSEYLIIMNLIRVELNRDKKFTRWNV